MNKPWTWKLAIPVAVLIIGYLVFGRGAGPQSNGAVFAVKRGPLKITVLEGGQMEAREFQEVKSDVKGQTKILSIVEEGYQVTEDDVKNGKVLVELDSADLLQRMTQQQIEFQGAVASRAQAQEQFEITQKQNESDITAAALDVKFKRIDFEKYLGAELGREILDSLALDPTGEKEESADVQSKRAAIDFSALAQNPKLQGDAKQMKNKLESENQLASQDLLVAEDALKWTKELASKEFATNTELQQDQMKVKRATVAQDSTNTAKQLYAEYEFPKMAEKLLSDYEESIRKLIRTKKQSISHLSQAEATLKASEARYQLEEQQTKELQEQIDRCVIKADRAGLVVYGGNERNFYGDDQIKEGAMVRQRQPIITIPDMTKMSVSVKVHESAIKQVKKGLKATITLDAFQDKVLTGEVMKVAVLPDSQQRWMNPDLKLYTVNIAIDGSNDWLRPGMSAQALILVNELSDVIYVPVQAVSESDGEHVCYVAKGLGSPEQRVVTVGEFTDESIEIKSGLKEGESVLLLSPTAQEDGGEDQGTPESEKNKKDEPEQPRPDSRPPNSEAPSPGETPK
ncbi:MAG: HlyD family efflux transporter periplasmic adaptor subunit [Candidatus Hydrogenedentes bacterium]|nr:HlyD family efflux transporter periplasmic adaptor subunit [Candidatus Hydrogenedentota bacterium]